MPAKDSARPNDRFRKAVLSNRFDGMAGYVLALLTVVLAFSIRFGLQGFLEDKAVFTLFIPAVLVTSMAAGIGPGLAAVALVQRSKDRRISIFDINPYAFMARQRTDSGRPHASMRLRTMQPMATSVC
jgi:hypothetical protein